MENIILELNHFLADLNVFYRKLQNYHWNVEGKDFFIVHAKLEEYYDAVSVCIDEIGEHILILGGQPLGTLKDYLSITKIEEAQNIKIKSEKLFKEVIKDFNYLLEKIICIKQIADKMNEYSTSALMDTYIQNYSKTLWMLKQSNY